MTNGQPSPSFQSPAFSLSPVLSVVIPAYNEEARIRATIERIIAYLGHRGLSAEIIVVDDGSQDQTVRSVEEAPWGVPVLTLRNGVNRGKGYSVKRGCLQARGGLILITDADLSTPIEEVEKLLPWFGRGYDVVIGSRGVDSSSIKRHQPVYREQMGKAFNSLVQALVLRGVKDTQCGFKCFTAPAAKAIFPLQSLSRFSFDVELLVIACSLGYRIREEPVNWYDSRQSHVRLLRDPLNMLLDLLKIYRRYGFSRLPPRE